MTAVPAVWAQRAVTVAGVRALMRDAARLACESDREQSISSLLERAAHVPLWGGHQSETHFVALTVCCKTVADWHGQGVVDISTPLPNLVAAVLLRDAANKITPADLAPWCDRGVF